MEHVPSARYVGITRDLSGPSSARGFFFPTPPHRNDRVSLSHHTRMKLKTSATGLCKVTVPRRTQGRGRVGGDVTMLPRERRESGVCVNLTMPAANPDPPAWRERRKQGRGQKDRCRAGGREREGGKTGRNSMSHLRSPHLLVACGCAAIMRPPLKLKTCRRRAHCGTHSGAHRQNRRTAALPYSDFINV